MSVRVRFAPSPTGYLHVGNIRAALINWLFARREGGAFVLRLDDTDHDRSEARFADAIVEDLEWLGLTPDETYRQSDRFDRYEAAAERLKGAGRLYPCYETAEELEIKRRIQISQKKPPVYDRAALKLTDAEAAAFEAEGRKPHWRFRIDLPARIEFVDLVRGPVSIDLASVSDPILIREDGSYLYTLPSVTDDLDMKISHVIRGEDHVTNSAVQVQIYEALGGKAPEFAHFALLAGAEGAGLSKRERTLAVRELREHRGIEPMTLVGLLARIGTSEPVEPFLDPAPLVDSFDFAKLTRATAHFDLGELEALNAKILHQTEFAAVNDRLGIDGADEAFWLVVRPNLTRLSDAADWWHVVHGAIEPVIEDRDFLAEAAAALPAGMLDEESWSAWTEKLSATTNRKGRALFHPLRLALTGRERGPEMRALLPLIGRERALKRLKGEAA